ncbi:MAG: protocatechuate 3,4-dioxygenase subunit beta [Roseovarius sp.]|nr:protocatechuate 3,4-dioxygenase subunit beta [Roseovarius sp.]
MTENVLSGWNRKIQPPAYTPDYKSSRARSPRQPLIKPNFRTSETDGPVFFQGDLGPNDNNLLCNFYHDGDPIGERILVFGRVLDENGKSVPGTLVEIWQANAAGRYRHLSDDYLAPLDPNFGGCGRTLTDEDGNYSFKTIRPGPYPWPNGDNSWRPAHIHISVFGGEFAQRLVSQIYFEGDPLIPLCPIINSVPDRPAINRLVAKLDMDASTPFDCLAYRFDVVLRGPASTLFENRLEGN